MSDHLTDALEAMLALQRNRLFWLSRSDEMIAQIREWKAEDEAEGCPWDESINHRTRRASYGE